MNRIKSSVFSFLAFLTIALLSIGSSYWNVNPSNKMDFPLTSVSKEKVAYFKDTTGKTRSFTSIEGALTAAGNDASTNTVFVVPGTNPTIHSSCTIASGDTLCLPYEGETYDGRQKESEKSRTWKTKATFQNGAPVSGDYIPESSGYSTTPFADSKAEFVSYFKKNEVTISANKTLTVSSGAFLNIGGILGWEGQIVTGQTSGKYCQITMETNSKIVNKGTIDCRGYIKEAKKDSNSEIVMPKGSTGIRKLPFVFYDYQGGKYTASVYGGQTKIFPLTQYDFPNVQSKRTFNYGSKLIGYVDLFTGEVRKTASVLGINVTAVLAARHNADDLEIIGPNSSDQKSLFEMGSSNATIVIKRNSSGNLYTTDPSLQPDSATKIDINGDVNFQSTKISIEAAGDASIVGSLSFLSDLLKAMTEKLNQTIDTSTVYFPLPWNILLAVNSNSSLTISSLMKMRPGSEINVSDTGTLTVGGKLIVYDDSRNSSLYQCPSGSDKKVVNPYPSDKGNAKVTNAGTRTIKNGASFGGLISALGDSGHINVETGSNLTVNDCHEGYGDYDISLSDVSDPVKFTFTDYSNSPVTKSACGAMIRKYYKTDIAPSYVYENRNQQLLTGGKTYNSYSSSNEQKTFGWYSTDGINDKYGIRLDYTNDKSEEIEISNNSNPNELYFIGNGNEVKLSKLTSKDSTWAFSGFYYNKNYTKPLKTENDSYIVEPSVAVGYVNNGVLTIYSKWISAGLITVNRYNGQSSLVTTQRDLSSGKTYHLTDFNINGNDSKPMKKVDKVSRTEFVFQNWTIYDASDASKANKLSSDGSFTPESGKSYVLEPAFKTNYYLYRSVTQNSWKSWGTTYYRMHNFKVAGNDTPQDSSEKNKMFSATIAGNSKTSTTYTAGWISLNSTISFDRESRSADGPNYVHIYIGDKEKVQIKGNKNSSLGSSNTKSCKIVLSQCFNDDFISGNGPISIKPDNSPSNNVQTI